MSSAKHIEIEEAVNAMDNEGPSPHTQISAPPRGPERFRYKMEKLVCRHPVKTALISAGVGLMIGHVTDVARGTAIRGE